jgi:hypothetical protein
VEFLINNNILSIEGVDLGHPLIKAASYPDLLDALSAARKIKSGSHYGIISKWIGKNDSIRISDFKYLGWKDFETARFANQNSMITRPGKQSVFFNDFDVIQVTYHLFPSGGLMAHIQSIPYGFIGYYKIRAHTFSLVSAPPGEIKKIDVGGSVSRERATGLDSVSCFPCDLSDPFCKESLIHQMMVNLKF